MSSEIEANNLLAKLNDALKVEVSSRHSYFQLKYFVVNKEPTVQAKMWQCLREMKSRRDALVALDMEIEESKDNAELLDIAVKRYIKLGVSKCEDKDFQSFNEGEHVVKLRQLNRKRSALAEKLNELAEKKKWMEEESQFFLETFKNLEQLEKLKPFDDLDSQKQYWGTKLAEKINLKMLLQNPLDMELIETILALPDDVPVKKQMVNRLNVIQTQLLEVKEEYKKKLTGIKNGAA